MLHFMLLGWTRNRAAAMGGAVLWLGLPSTLAVHHFLATRHYMDGLFFGLLAAYCVRRLCDQSRRPGRDASLIVAAAICGGTAMLFKEIYAAIVPAYLFMTGIDRRRREVAVLAVVMALGYAGYRVWMVGTDMTYTMPFLDFGGYLAFLAAMPYTISANYGGYLLLGAAGILTAKRFRNDPAATREAVFLFALTSAALVAVYPVAFAVLANHRTPGTWYRIPFIFNTLFVVWIVHVGARLRRLTAVLALSAVIVLPGTERTRQYWDQRMARAEAEGLFYLQNPDKLLYSEEDATWFIPGVHRLYASGRSTTSTSSRGPTRMPGG